VLQLFLISFCVREPFLKTVGGSADTLIKDIEDANVSTAHPIDNIFFKPFIFTSLINLFNHGYVLIIYQKFTKINIIIKIN